MKVGLYDCDLINFAPRYESSITWKTVGNTVHLLDDGLVADHWGTTLTVTGSWDDLVLIHYFLESNMASTITLTCTEPIFGPQFNYASSFSVIVKSVDSLDEQFAEIGSLTFSVDANLYSRYSTEDIATIDFNLLFARAIKRDNNYGAKVSDNEIGFAGTTYAPTARTATVTLMGKRSYLEPRLKWLQTGLRGATLEIDYNYLWLFNPDELVNNCKIVSIGNLKAIDLGFNWWTFDLTVVKV